MGVIADLTEKLKSVCSWDSLEIPGRGIPFRDFGHQALDELGQEAVPFFREPEHLATGFTGLVRCLSLYGGALEHPRIIEDADLAYIDNGSIVYTQKDASKLFQGEQHKKVSLRKGHFRVDEEYAGWGFPRSDEVNLFKRMRTAEYFAEPQALRVQVTQNQDGILRVRLDEYNEERKRGGYRGCGAVEIGLEKKDACYGEVMNALQANPELFADPRNILPLFRGVPIHTHSNVYYGFKDGKRGEDFSPTTRIIEGTLTFEDALKIAFPGLLGR